VSLIRIARRSVGMLLDRDLMFYGHLQNKQVRYMTYMVRKYPELYRSYVSPAYSKGMVNPTPTAVIWQVGNFCGCKIPV